ncbi:C-terminal binding protein [Cohnella herbarum]|uniref:C-terminal binding protein n=1 Tax=Cohnella herbarum TaxID=2728023 RepID=A0A7Z2VFS6_9BACL|nr:C-terminal binding protein [Cohnella herbarum]QJD82110.1 C-terminal binding protein [Cohnella herbarum]
MKIVITDSNFTSDQSEREVLAGAGLTLERFNAKTIEEMKEAGKDATAVLVQFSPAPREVLESWKSCKLIVRYGIGYDNVDVQAATELGITVCNVPSYCLDEVADHTASLLLSGLRKIVAFDASVRRGEWNVEKVAKPIRKFDESIIGLVGFGRIGARVAARMRPFGFEIMAYDPYLSEDKATELGVKKAASLRELLSVADAVSLHSPLTAETHHMINEQSLSWMKPNAWIVNTSRGGLINTVDLARALLARKLDGAALDVFEREPLEADHPLRQCANVILTPHAAYYSDASIDNLQRQAAEEIVRFAKGEPLQSPVNRV